jgi:hypothetical protein
LAHALGAVLRTLPVLGAGLDVGINWLKLISSMWVVQMTPENGGIDQVLRAASTQ